ncbi:uncharacterized protein LOC117336063 isoform X2 [Pecten maximus]|uniref:uncharacterized protein LOC117336063 isoform X2 n=1 Tax=Pecten maximus TaxID=6579 RepID=UPI0014591771|nr:uncharacterized protein LOC117336063 isoform X2 [Pecten maximus]
MQHKHLIFSCDQHTTVDSVEVGGYCISYAQQECRNLSDPLYEGIFKPTPTTDICSLFDTYHHCIQGITLNCPITAAEKTFYDTSFVQFFKKEYECHISTTGTLHQSDKNGGSVYKWNSLWSLWWLMGYVYLINHQFTTFT